MPSSSNGLIADIRAGLNAALIGIPQEINYGLLAFGAVSLTFAIYGVFAAFAASAIGTLLYCLLGGGLNQVVGPRPTLVVLVTGFFSSLLGSGMPPGELPLTLTLSMSLVGILLMLSARLGLGDLFKYMPHPVLGGFTNGVAATIFLSSLPMALGASFSLNQQLGLIQFRFASLLVTALTVWICFRPLTMGVFRQIPSVLQALLFASLLQFALAKGSPLLVGPTIGDLLGHLVAPGEFIDEMSWPTLDLSQWSTLGKFVLAITIAAALETMATTTQIEAESSQQSPGNQVLRRLGLTYLLLAPFMMPVAASLGRSVALSRTGARTRASQILYALFLIGLSIFCYPLISQLPQAAIAGVLIVVARSMVGDTVERAITSIRNSISKVDRARHLADLAVLATVALITVLDGFMMGLAVGIVVAMGLFIRDQSRSVVRSVLYGDLCTSLRVRSPVARELQAWHGREIVIVEAEGVLFFGSMDKIIARLNELSQNARALVLDLRRVTDIDQTACQLLMMLVRRSSERGCQLRLANISEAGSLHRMLRAHGVQRDLPESHWFPTLDLALECAENELLQRYGLSRDALSKVPLSASDLSFGLDAGQIQTLEGFLERRKLAAGAMLFGQGDVGDSLFVICHGAISIQLQGTTVKRLIAFGPGALFGEMALITGAPRSAGAVADEESELLELTRQQFARLQAIHPEIAVTVLRQIAILLSERLRNTTRQLQQFQS